MSFVVSKLLWPIAQPGGLALLLLVVGAGLLWLGRARAGRVLVGVAALVLVGFGVLPAGDWLIRPLEQRFAAAPLPERVDGIVVLGGAVQPVQTAIHGRPALNDAAERMTAFVGLARRHPEAKLVFTGGSGSLLTQGLKEAAVARALFAELGLDPDRVVYEAESRNTWENAVLTKALVAPAPGETWVLVTSAFHMPRSMGIFRKVGWPVLPHPVDFRAGAGGWRFALPDETVAVAVHEWLGLLAYRALGRTDALFPGPN